MVFINWYIFRSDLFTKRTLAKTEKMHLLPVLLAENILQLQTIHNCFACKQKNKGGKEKGFSGDMYVQTISNTPVHFSKNSKQKFEYKTKKVFWHHLDGAMTGKQTVSFLYLFLIFAIHSVDTLKKYMNHDLKLWKSL